MSDKSLLPDLRLAFSVFTPVQLDRLGGIVANMLGLSHTGLTAVPAVSEALLALGRELDRFARLQMEGGDGP